MSLIRNSQKMRLMKAGLIAQFALYQRRERIKWEAEVLNPKLDEWLRNANVPNPEPPSNFDITIEYQGWSPHEPPPSS